MKEEVEQLIKTVKDATEALTKARAEEKESVKQTVEQVLKDVLANHPGVTQPRKIEFPEAKQFGPQAIIERLPVEAQKELDDCFIMSKILNKPVQHLKSWSRWTSKYGEFKKALDTATAAGGLEWVPTDFSSNLWELVRVQGQVAALFPTIAMPTKVYELPLQVGRVVSYKHSEQTGDSPTKITVGDGGNLTGKITLTAADHAARVLVSKNLEEDSIIPVLPWLQRQIVLSLAEGREDCIINGDTAGTQDSDDSNAAGHNRMWDGLRRLALANSYTADLATYQLPQIRENLRAPMGRYGVNPGALAHIVDLSTYIRLVGLDVVNTLDKFGPNATVLKGQLGNIDGSPVIVTEWSRNNLNASGVYDSVTTSKGSHLLVNRDGFVIGERRQADMMVLRELYAESRQDAVVVSERVTFAPTYPIATNRTVSMGYNVGKTKVKTNPRGSRRGPRGILEEP